MTAVRTALAAILAHAAADPAPAPATTPAAAPVSAPAFSPIPVATPVAAATPPTAAAALDRATAAYEYGDIHQVIEAARMVADGALPASDAERADALRLLGVGLYLTGRPDGAEVAFRQLFALRPRATLDRATTRPEVVVFFEEIRRRQLRERPFLWNFVPPLGQFQNGDRTRGWTILAVEATAVAGTITTAAILARLRGPTEVEDDDYPTAKLVRTLHFTSLGLLSAAYLYGVIDGVVGYGRDDTRSENAQGPQVRVALFPEGAGVAVSF